MVVIVISNTALAIVTAYRCMWQLLALHHRQAGKQQADGAKGSKQSHDHRLSRMYINIDRSSFFFRFSKLIIFVEIRLDLNMNIFHYYLLLRSKPWQSCQSRHNPGVQQSRRSCRQARLTDRRSIADNSCFTQGSKQPSGIVQLTGNVPCAAKPDSLTLTQPRGNSCILFTASPIIDKFRFAISFTKISCAFSTHFACHESKRQVVVWSGFCWQSFHHFKCFSRIQPSLGNTAGDNCESNTPQCQYLCSYRTTAPSISWSSSFRRHDPLVLLCRLNPHCGSKPHQRLPRLYW